MSLIELSLVIPAYNEAANIEQCLVEAEQACRHAFKTFEIIVVDDGSRDQTAAIARACAARLPNIKVTQKPNGGIGSAVTLGFQQATGTLLTYAPADRQFDPRELPKLVAALAGADLVVGGKEQLTGYGFKRRMTSLAMRVLLRVVFGITYRDVNFIHLYRASAYRKIVPRSPGGFFHAETIALALHRRLKIAETFLTLRPRPAGVATAWSLRNIRRTLREMILLRWRLWFSQV